MKIDYISDLHIDMYFDAHKLLSEEAFRELFEDIILDYGRRTPGDVLVIAGDLGHSNEQNQSMLHILQKRYYKHIVFVLGNHDYYLTEDLDASEYKDSFDRVNAMRAWASKQKHIHCLDGTVVEIDGIRFGGCDGWYDGTYAYRHFEHNSYLPKESVLADLWRTANIDPKRIKGVKHFKQLWEIERKKIHQVYRNCDIMVTHTNPSIKKEHSVESVRENKTNAFFTFDGLGYAKSGSMKYWIFGHTNTVNSYEAYGVKFVCNPIGYDDGSYMGDWSKIRSIEMEKGA